MSELVPSVLPLDKGLDLQTAKIIAPPGSVLDSINYEQVDFQGQKRIEGYTRYDGSALSAIDEYYVIALEAGSPSLVEGNLLLKDNVLFGIVAFVEAGLAYYVRVNDAVPIGQDTSVTVRVVNGSSSTSSDWLVVTNESGTATAVDADTHYTTLLRVMSVVRSRVGMLPGGIAGLHWFKDRLYAVADTAFVILVNQGITVYPNDVITVDGVDFPVYDSFVAGTSLVILIQSTYKLPAGSIVFRGETNLGAVVEATFSADYEQYATIFESRNEQQVLAEDAPTALDFGWRAKHLGWTVNYEDGLALYGDLAAVNQNRQNVGIEGPTSTAGPDGSPGTLYQKVAISSQPPQVNGWKSYDSPTTYVLDPTDIQQADNRYIYADAFVSWSANTSEVLTPGSNLQGLVEYDPNSTIRYTTL